MTKPVTLAEARRRRRERLWRWIERAKFAALGIALAFAVMGIWEVIR